jgi:hypothetical protein
MGVTASSLLSLTMRVRTVTLVWMLASCHGRDGAPTSSDGCARYCNWAAKCSSGDELNADYELVDCAERSCGDSCAADEHEDCTFEWP